MMKIGFIGAGNMGSALARACSRSGAKLYIYDKDTEKAQALCAEIGAEFAENYVIAEQCDYIFLAVKPNIIPAAIADIRFVLKDRTDAVLVSMAAGVSISKISECIDSFPVIRIMPNTPAAVGEGLILYCHNKLVTKTMLSGFCDALCAAGAVEPIDEGKIDAAAAISGCGPAFVYMFIEALADGGVQCGLARDAAQRFAARTVLGAAKTVLESGKHPGELKDAVCSPGGTTIEGVHSLEESGFRAAGANAVIAAYEKTQKLMK